MTACPARTGGGGGEPDIRGKLPGGTSDDSAKWLTVADVSVTVIVTVVIARHAS